MRGDRLLFNHFCQEGKFLGLRIDPDWMGIISKMHRAADTATVAAAHPDAHLCVRLEPAALDGDVLGDAHVAVCGAVNVQAGRRVVVAIRVNHFNLPGGTGFQFIIERPALQIDSRPPVMPGFESFEQAVGGAVIGVYAIAVRCRGRGYTATVE